MTAGNDPTCEPLFGVATDDAGNGCVASTESRCNVPAALDVNDGITRSGNGLGSCSVGASEPADAMVWPNPAGPVVFSDPLTGPVMSQNVTLDSIQGDPVGNPASQPAGPDGFELRGSCGFAGNPSPDCQLVVLTATRGASSSFGNAFAAFEIDGNGQVFRGSAVSSNGSFFPPTPTPTATALTPTPTSSAAPSPALQCPPTPRSACRTSAVSSIRVRHDGSDRNRLTWRWTRGAVTSQEEFGDPIASTDYALCLYDSDGLAAQLDLPHGGQCDGQDCWRIIPATGFTYRAQSAVSDGVLRVVLRGSSTDKARIILRARGSSLPNPSLPFAAPVVVQLANSSTAVCWESRFELSDVRENGSERFRAR